MLALRKKNKKRMLNLLIGISVLLCLLAIRIFWIQIIQNEWFKVKAYEQQTNDYDISPKRGDILDRNGEKLAVSATVYTVIVNPREISAEKRDGYAGKLSEILKLDKETVLSKIEKDSSYQIIKKKIEQEETDAVRQWIKDEKVSGVALIEDSKRFYPNNNLASHIIGFTSVDNVGLSGIEATMEKELKGEPGRILSEVDAGNRQIPNGNQEYIEATQGYNVVLTIDEQLQYIAQNNLEKACIDNAALNGGDVIVMDPRNGDVLAMASYPTFDLNNPYAAPPGENPNIWNGSTEESVQKLSNGVWRNKAVNDTYEPGSTFKAVTTCMGIEEGTYTPDTVVTDAPIDIPGGKKINCWKSPIHGTETFREAVQNSCNPVFCKVAKSLGGGDTQKAIDKYYDYVKNFGFFDKTGIGLPGESSSIMHKNPTELDMFTSSFGQSFTITPIQLITAYAPIANGGTLYKPRLVKELRDQDGNVVKKFEPQVVRQVISKETSQTVSDILKGVVSDGTGKNAYVEGYRVAGKTGTSETVESRFNISNRKIASFCSYAPADDPVIEVLIILDYPTGPNGNMGGTIAAPVAGKILDESLNYLNVERKYSDRDKQQLLQTSSVPDVCQMKLSDAENTLKKNSLDYTVEGAANPDSIIMAQTPKKGAQVSINSKVILYTYKASEEITVTVPDLKGKKLSDAIKTLQNIGLNIKISGLGVASKQNIPPGTKVSKGTVVEVNFISLEVD